MDSGHVAAFIAIALLFGVVCVVSYVLNKTEAELAETKRSLSAERKEIIRLAQELGEANAKIGRLERNQQDFLESNEARLNAMAMALFESGRLHVSLRKT